MRVRFISPWYPDYAHVHSGIFVAKQVGALRVAGHQVIVDSPQLFPAPPGSLPNAVTAAMRSLAEHSLDAMFASVDGVTYVPTPVPSRGGPMGRAEAMTASLGLLEELRPANVDIDHAHLGMPTAWAVSRTRKTPLVVTEHQSTLGDILAEPRAAEAYADVVRRADAFICVSEHLRDQIADAVGPWASEKILVVPNIVDLTDIDFRERPRPQFSSWIYIGGLMAHKGVQDLLRSFAAYVKKWDENATLTLVGQGPLRNWIEVYAGTRGLADSVSLLGSVAHEDLGIHLEKADVMVHLSPFETFGIAPLEGIGAGLPVIALANDGSLEAWGDIAEKCGLILPLDSTPERVADAIAALRDSPDRLDPSVGRRTIIDRYSPDRIASRLTSVYEQVLS